MSDIHPTEPANPFTDTSPNDTLERCKDVLAFVQNSLGGGQAREVLSRDRAETGLNWILEGVIDALDTVRTKQQEAE